jgi:hypothetical protein
MHFIPLSQIESVDLVIHALRAAAGQADCSLCPARKVCMQQCLTIADSIETMVRTGTLPHIGPPDPEPPTGPEGSGPAPAGDNGPRLRIIK